MNLTTQGPQNNRTKRTVVLAFTLAMIGVVTLAQVKAQPLGVDREANLPAQSEVKYRIDLTRTPLLLVLNALSLSPVESKPRSMIILDTPDGTLESLGIQLRVRKDGDKNHLESTAKVRNILPKEAADFLDTKGVKCELNVTSQSETGACSFTVESKATEEALKSLRLSSPLRGGIQPRPAHLERIIEQVISNDQDDFLLELTGVSPLFPPLIQSLEVTRIIEIRRWKIKASHLDLPEHSSDALVLEYWTPILPDGKPSLELSWKVPTSKRKETLRVLGESLQARDLSVMDQPQSRSLFTRGG